MSLKPYHTAWHSRACRRSTPVTRICLALIHLKVQAWCWAAVGDYAELGMAWADHLWTLGTIKAGVDNEPHNDRTTGSAAFVSRPVEFKVMLEIYLTIANRLERLSWLIVSNPLPAAS